MVKRSTVLTLPCTACLAGAVREGGGVVVGARLLPRAVWALGGHLRHRPAEAAAERVPHISARGEHLEGLASKAFAQAPGGRFGFGPPESPDAAPAWRGPVRSQSATEPCPHLSALRPWTASSGTSMASWSRSRCGCKITQPKKGPGLLCISVPSPRRQSFPRLFFFSDAVLLQFLRLFGKRSSPRAMELLARQCFPGARPFRPFQ